MLVECDKGYRFFENFAGFHRILLLPPPEVTVSLLVSSYRSEGPFTGRLHAGCLGILGVRAWGF